MRVLLLAVTLLTFAVAEEPRPPERHLPPPSDLSPMARQLLKQRMARHGKTMSDLVQSVIVLDYTETARLSREIAEEPRLARPLSATDLNATLPDKFFQLQDQLHDRAHRLAEVARTRNGAAMSSAFGELSETCVDCHRVYSTGRTP